MKKVFLVVLYYKDQKATFELIETLKDVRKETFDLHTVIVDNYPQDPIKINPSDYKDLNLRVIYNKENLGFSGGNNIGITESLKNGADFILILSSIKTDIKKVIWGKLFGTREAQLIGKM
ncbi:MAG: Rhamnosyl transferase, rfbQ [Microgenomates group bacterium GW2011_GWA2_37_6]|nr:MAG: Rhamnosyl transferase, rfbQ [Microgenomates group bacterium GW2011_GWA2_37_6]